MLMGLKCVQFYLAYFQNRKSIKLHCINIHLTVIPLTLNIHSMCNLLYMNVTHYQKKTIVQQSIFGSIFIGLLKITHIYRTHQSFINANKELSVIMYKILFSTIIL